MPNILEMKLEKLHQVLVSIGLEDLKKTIDTQRPCIAKPRRRLTAMTLCECIVCLRKVLVVQQFCSLS